MSTPSRSRRTLAAGMAALSLGAGALGVVALGPAGAQEPTPDGGGGRVGVLDELVADGTITEAQAVAIRDQVREHREEHPGRGGRRLHLLRGALRTSAEAIGIEPDALRDRLRAGESVAGVAEAEGVARQTVIDALVAAGTERLDQAVADGRITRERADQAAAHLSAAAARLVDHTR